VWKNVPYLGQGVSAAKAQDHVTRWNNRELPVLALHPFSAGHGLNLQKGGSHICWYALPWPLESYQQTNGRIDRQGQTRACFGHHIVVADSMDERVSDALRSKDVDQDAIVKAIRRV
jgi:SNF2 family DNA or RNA helicase